jgi:hypothetical protein
MNKNGEQRTLIEAVDSGRSDDWDSYEWQQKREQRLEMDNHQCCNCGRSDLQLHVHHIVPDANDGTTRIKNLRTLCYDCHDKAHLGNIAHLSESSNPSSASYIPTVPTMQKFFSAVTHPLDQAILLLFAKTGVKVNEAVSLQLQDIHLRNSPIGYHGIGPLRPSELNHFVVHEKNTEGIAGARGPRLTDTQIPIDRELAIALRKWLAIRPDPIPAVEGEPVFLNISDNWGGEMTPSIIRSRMKKYAIETSMYEDTKNTSDNITPMTLSQFFKVRFGGQPITRDYILGKCEDSRIHTLNSITITERAFHNSLNRS